MRIKCFPNVPYHGNKVGVWCKELGWELMRYDGEQEPGDVMMWWDVSSDPENYLNFKAWGEANWINKKVTDITKTQVARKHEEVFGYTSRVWWPDAWRGVMVEKGNGQYTKDGRIVKGPTVPQGDKIYMKLIDNRVEDGMCEEFRVIVFGRRVRMVIKKTYRADQVFKNEFEEMKVVEKFDVFMPSELKNLERFAQKFHLDMGELDVLRDSDGRLYVIDVNQCAGSGFLRICKPEEAYRMRELFVEFIKGWKDGAL